MDTAFLPVASRESKPEGPVPITDSSPPPVFGGGWDAVGRESFGWVYANNLGFVSPDTFQGNLRLGIMQQQSLRPVF